MNAMYWIVRTFHVESEPDVYARMQEEICAWEDMAIFIL